MEQRLKMQNANAHEGMLSAEICSPLHFSSCPAICPDGPLVVRIGFGELMPALSIRYKEQILMPGGIQHRENCLTPGIVDGPRRKSVPKIGVVGGVDPEILIQESSGAVRQCVLNRRICL